MLLGGEKDLFTSVGGKLKAFMSAAGTSEMLVRVLPSLAFGGGFGIRAIANAEFIDLSG